MAYATAADVEARFVRPLEEFETRAVNIRLGDAELLLKTKIPDLDDKVASGEIPKAVVVMIEADMVLRLIRNPDGYVQETDGNYSYSISPQVASGVLEVLPREWSLLGVRQSAFVIAPTFQLPWLQRDPEWPGLENW